MRKPLNLLMIGVLALLVAVSCGSGDQSTAKDTDESASAVGSEGAGDLGDLPPIHAGGGGGKAVFSAVRCIEGAWPRS